MTKKVNVCISDYGGGRTRRFEILDREVVEDILSELDEHDIHRRCIDLADKYSATGAAYVYIDARDGGIKEYWIQSNSELHPWDNFYRIVLVGVRSPIDWSNEDFILEKYGEEGLEKRRDWVIDFWIDNLELREDIDEQMDLLYAASVVE